MEETMQIDRKRYKVINLATGDEQFFASLAVAAMKAGTIDGDIQERPYPELSYQPLGVRP
jgi:hypothetical protein